MSLFHIKKTKFKEYYNKFKKEENEKNYNKLKYFLLCKIKEIKRTYRITVGILLTNKNGVLIFNSKQENTFSKYKKGEIHFNDLDEITSSNLANKKGFTYYGNNRRKLICSLKIGSTISMFYDQLEEGNVWAVILTVLFLLLILVAVGGLVYYFSKINETGEVTKEVVGGASTSEEGVITSEVEANKILGIETLPNGEIPLNLDITNFMRGIIDGAINEATEFSEETDTTNLRTYNSERDVSTEYYPDEEGNVIPVTEPDPGSYFEGIPGLARAAELIKP